MDSLGINDLEVIRVWPSSGRKVYQAERAIRTVGKFFHRNLITSYFQFKETVGRIVFIKQVHVSKWPLYIQEALKIINKNVVRMTKSSLASHYIKEGIFQKQYRSLPDLPFVYQIGDYVVLKSLATSKGREDKDRPGFKRSLGIYFNNINYLFYFSGI